MSEFWIAVRAVAPIVAAMCAIGGLATLWVAAEDARRVRRAQERRRLEHAVWSEVRRQTRGAA